MIHNEYLLHRHEGNPIIKPSDFPGGADGVRNCGQTMFGSETILLVSVDHRADGYRGVKGRTTHVARSSNGVDFVIDPDPFFQTPSVKDEELYGRIDQHPIDPRVTKIDNVYYITRPGGGWECEWGTCVILNKTTDFKTSEYLGVIGLPQNRGASLFPEKINGMYAKLDRPSGGVEDGNIWISYSSDLLHWGGYRPVLAANYATWNYYKIGPTPPVKTKDGWLEIIHGVSGSCAGKRYFLGAVLLDLEDPSIVLGKTMSYILAPLTSYEQNGRVPNIVFACGCIPDYETDTLRVYYGAADTSICLATGSITEIVEACLNNR